MGYYLSVLTFTSITVVAITSIYVITGLTGLFSLGQAAFMAVGAYTSGILITRLSMPFLPSLVTGILVGMLAAFLVGIPTLKLRRDYIALVTFGFGEAIIAILNNTANVTGGAMGLIGIRPYTTTPIAVGFAVLAVVLARNFKYSRFGRQCIAVRNDEVAAASTGVNVAGIKMMAFLFGSALTALAGTLYASYTTYVEPGLFQWTLSAEWIIIVFFGGVNSLTGAVVAAVLLGTLPEILRAAAEWRIAIYSILVLIIINYRPSGVFGEYELPLWRGISRRIRRVRG